MSMKLVVIMRNKPFGIASGDFRREVRGMIPAQIPGLLEDMPHHYRTRGDVFLVDDRDVQNALEIFSSENPGREVQVYNLEQIAVCPAAPMIVKQVSKDGVLPL